MFISVLELFKIGIGPSSSHTYGPMVAANSYISGIINKEFTRDDLSNAFIRCILKGSLSYTGKGHSTDKAIVLGLHGFTPNKLTEYDVNKLINRLWHKESIEIEKNYFLAFIPDKHIIFDKGKPLPEHPNGMIFELISRDNLPLDTETYFSIGGGFILNQSEIGKLHAPLDLKEYNSCKYPFDSAKSMLEMAKQNQISIGKMKEINELKYLEETVLNHGIDNIWYAMKSCVEKGLATDGILPGGLGIIRRAKKLYQDIKQDPEMVTINDWLCAYAMAVNEENAAGNMIVTAPTNGAAGVIPAILYYFMTHQKGTIKQMREFLLTASAIGGLIKHRSSISGAEVGCQGEVGSASAMAAAGLCAVLGGTPEQVENAAEIALEHHLGMTCDPVNGLVQVPCIERNGFGAIKAHAATSLALRGTGQHFMPLDNCIAAMKQTGLEMSDKYKETSLGGLAVSITEC